MGPGKSLGRWLLYGACLTPALIMLGSYWLEYVPAQREYFMNLRFRTLAIIGDQVRSKLGSLATSLDYAGKSREPQQYLSELVPDLDYEVCESPVQTPIEFGKPEGSIRFPFAEHCVVASLSRLFSNFVGDDLFDDVLVADDKGHVVYQRSTSSPRLASLTELIKTAPAANNAPQSGSGSDADAAHSVRLDDSDFMLLLQPVTISLASAPNLHFMAGGLVRSSRLATEAHHVPPKYLLVLFAPVLVILLSGPFLKILLLTRTGRLAFREIALLCLFTLFSAGLVTVLLASWHQYFLSERQAEPDLKKFATNLNQWLVSDIDQMRSALERFDASLPDDASQIRDRTDLRVSDLPARFPGKPAPFDFVFWANADGCQAVKWTTKHVNTGRVDQKPEEHFRNIVARKFWGSQGKPFTMQARVSPTTSQLIVVLAIPSSHRALRLAGCNNAQPSPIVSAAMVASLPSVAAPLVPPGAGFAVFEPSGRVLFHSSSERDLHESLFEEVHDPDRLRAGVRMRAAQTFSTYYRGRQYRFQIQPLTGLAGVPWSLAVFQELEPRQAMIGLVWAESLMLFVALLCVITATFLLICLALKITRGWSWRRQVDFFLIHLWPDPARRRTFHRLAWVLTAMFLISLIAIAVGWVQGYHSGAWLLPFCFLLPLAATAVTVFSLRKSDPADWGMPATGRNQSAYVVCLSLLLVLVAVLPATGLFGVCQAYETRLYLMHWQRELLSAVDGRRARMTALADDQQASDRGASDFLRDSFLLRIRQDASSDRRKYLDAFWQTKLSDDQVLDQPVSANWWQALLNKIRPEVGPEARETGALARAQDVDTTATPEKGVPRASAPAETGSCRWRGGESGGGNLTLQCEAGFSASMSIQSVLPVITLPSDPLWWIVALMLAGGIYAWDCLAFCRLFNLDFLYTPLPALTDLGPPDKFRGHLLVLGLPLVRKDGAVREWLHYAPPRVNLYEAHFSYNWLEQTVERLRAELAAESAGASRAAAAGTSAVQTVLAAPATPWLHISNLEAKLGDSQDRQVVASLLEKLVLMEVNGVRVRLVMTSAVDPVFHFDSVLSDERKKIYEHPLPEPELQRLARILHNFRKVRVPTEVDCPPEWKDLPARDIVYAECRHHPALMELGSEVVHAATKPGQSQEAVLAMIAERAHALYKLFWASCTRSEKLLLIQLAQTGLVNPLCLDTLEDLMRKGLILPGARPRIMNQTFQQFLRKVEVPETVRQWEGEAGESSWLIIRNAVLGLLALGLVVLALTQQPALQTVTAVLTGVGTVMAGLFRVFGFFSTRRGTNAGISAGPE